MSVARRVLAARRARVQAEVVATTLVLLALSAVLVWNAARYPPTGGYDATEHISYARLLVDHGDIPGSQARSEYYTPPGFYAVAGAATWLGREIGLPVPERLALALNAAIVLATALVVVALARLLLPDHAWARVGVLGFFSFLPMVTRLAAMFHPEPLDLLLTTIALYLTVRLLRRRDWRLRTAVMLGGTLALGQLVRAFSLWTSAVVLLTIVAAGMSGYVERRVAARIGAVVLATTIVVTAPWYVRQAIRYSNPVFDRPTEKVPLLQRRPLSFYFGLGLPAMFTGPARPSFLNEAIPTTYSGLWGDYEGYFAWGYGKPAAPAPKARLGMQNALGLLPTAIAIGGWLLLLGTVLRRRLLRRDPALLAVGLLPAAALLGYLYFTVSYPTPNGNVLKASYMLTATPAWALAFGVGLRRLARWRRLSLGVAVLLVASLPIDFAFLFYRL